MSIDLEFVFLSILAVFKLAELISVEIGPYEIFERFRVYIGKLAADKGKGSFVYQFSNLILCQFCLGIWLSFLMGALILFRSQIGDLFIVIMAISGGHSILRQIASRNEY